MGKEIKWTTKEKFSIRESHFNDEKKYWKILAILTGFLFIGAKKRLVTDQFSQVVILCGNASIGIFVWWTQKLIVIGVVIL